MLGAGAAVIGALTGCNEVFDLESTHIADAAVRPAPHCPASGELPAFHGDLRQLSARECTSYTPNLASDTAVATCGGAVMRGPLSRWSAHSVASNVLLWRNGKEASHVQLHPDPT